MADAGPAREPSTFAGGGAGGSDAVPVNRCPDRPDDPAFVDGSDCAGVDAIHVLRSLEYFGIGQAWGDVDGDGSCRTSYPG